MKVIGLTGGIASGKSTVSRMLRELGAPIVDADLIARQLVEPGQPTLGAIVRAFGSELLDADGRLVREKLATIVFASPARRLELNALVHPAIAQASRAQLDELAAGGHAHAVYEAALLVENGVHHQLDGLIVVALDEQRQLERAMARDGFSLAEARARLAAQAPLLDKIAAADYVIDNNSTEEETRAQVQAVWRDIQTGGPRSPAVL